MHELVDIVDTAGNPTGEVISKDEAHRTGALHRVIHLHMYTSNGYLIFQQRSATKKFYPWVLDFAVWGHIRAGEDLLAWLERETKEELWLTLGHSCLQLAWVFLHTIEHPQYNMLDNEVIFDYIYRFDGNIELFHFQDGEVDAMQVHHLDTLLHKGQAAYEAKNIRWYQHYPEIIQKISNTLI